MALNKWATAILCSWLIFGIMATVAVALRLWSRRILKVRFAFNDYAIIMALVWTYGLFAVSLIYIFLSGLGDNERDLPMKDVVILFKTFAPGAILWALANSSVKASILHLYICLFPLPRFRLAAYIIMVLTAIYIIFSIITLTICHPYSYFSHKGLCGNQVAFYITSGVFNLLLDITVIVLPMPMLWGLQMVTRKKVVLTVIFGIGAGICIISILRIVYLTNLDLHNITYDVAPEWLFTLLEPTLGIVSACVPAMQPAITKLSPKRSSTVHCGNGKAGCSTSAKNGTYGQNSAFSPRRFQRLDEYAHPLTDRYGHLSNNHVGRAGNDACDGDQDVDEHAYVASDLRDRRRSIVVKSGWPIHDNAV